MRARRSQAEWVRIVAAFEGSGLSAAEFCRRRDLSTAALGWWRWRLRREGRDSSVASQDVRLVPVEVVGELVPATPASDARRPTVSVTFDGLALELEVGTDVAYVGALVRALRSC